MTRYNTDKIGASYLNRLHGEFANTKMVLSSVKTLSPEIRNNLNPERRLNIFIKTVRNIESSAHKQKLNLLIESYISAVVVKKKDIPESYFQNQAKIAEERGFKDLKWTREAREKEMVRIQNEQKASLRIWTDYLISGDAKTAYPLWFRFYVLHSVSKLRSIVIGGHIYPKRDRNTIAAFPGLNQRALAELYTYINSSAKLQFDEKNIGSLSEGVRGAEKERIKNKRRNLDTFGQLAYQGRFSKLYFEIGQKQHLRELAVIKKGGKSITSGEWVAFKQGSDSGKLEKALQGKMTGWCITGSETAQKYLKEGDIYVYFTYDKKGNLSFPRIAIKMENGSVVEVRGISKDQNLESGFVHIAKEKYRKLPGGDKYDKMLFRLIIRGNRFLRRHFLKNISPEVLVLK